MKKIRDVSLIVLVVCAMTLVVEGAYRFFFHQEKQISNPYWFTYHPYLGFTQTPNARRAWGQLEHNGSISPGVLVTNNFGFMTPKDFDLFTKYKKAPNEKVILLSGGSAMMGVGVPNNEQTIAYQLEKTLNMRQTSHKYTVVNLASGGWSAYNQFVALDLFGSYLRPDWIITMDGSNDLTKVFDVSAYGTD